MCKILERRQWMSKEKLIENEGEGDKENTKNCNRTA